MRNKIRAIVELPGAAWELFIAYLPGEVGIRLRYRFWRKRLRFLGADVRIEAGVHFQNPEYITIHERTWIDRNVVILAGPPSGERTTHRSQNTDYHGNAGEVHIGAFSHIAQNCVLSGMGGLSIGRNCGVAANSAIYTFSHHYRNLANREDKTQYSFTPMARPDQQAMILAAVVIEDYCGVGLASVILPGTTLKEGTWIGSGTIVSGTYPRQTLVFREAETRTKDLSEFKIRR